MWTGRDAPVSWRVKLRGGPFALSFEAGPQRRRASMPEARRRTHRRGPGLDHENREEREVSRPIPDRTPSRRGARHRATWSRVCRACADNGLAPRARRSEAPGYAWLGEHARAVAARRTAPGPSARHHHQAGGPEGPVGTSSSRPDGPAGVVASRGAVAPAKATCVRTVA